MSVESVRLVSVSLTIISTWLTVRSLEHLWPVLTGVGGWGTVWRWSRCRAGQGSGQSYPDQAGVYGEVSTCTMILTLNIQVSRSGTVWRWSRCRAGQGWKTSHWLHGSSWLEHSHSRGLDKGNGVPYLRAELSRLTYQLAIWLPLTQKTQLASTLELHSMATSPNWGDSLTSDDHFLAGSPRWLFYEGLFFITNRDPSKSKQFFMWWVVVRGCVNLI
jgi:hypothetical protein